MTVAGSGPKPAALFEARYGEDSSGGRVPARAETLSPLAMRVRGEFHEMPGLRLTVGQAARLFGVMPDIARDVLQRLQRAEVLTCSHQGTYALASRDVTQNRGAERESNGASTMPDAAREIDLLDQ